MGFNIVEGEPAPPGRFTLSNYIPNNRYLHTYDQTSEEDITEEESDNEE